jgi:hypothetical protein
MAKAKARINLSVSVEEKDAMNNYARIKGLSLTDYILLNCLNPIDKSQNNKEDILQLEIQYLKKFIEDKEQIIREQKQAIKEEQQKHDITRFQLAAAQAPWWRRKKYILELPNNTKDNL